MTDVIIVHSRLGNAESHWYQWLKHKLILEGYDVQLFNLPNTKEADLHQWITEMNHQLEIRKQDTYFVTHGFGTIASLKYIELINEPIKGLFSISGYKEDASDIHDDLNLSGIHIDYEKVKELVKNFYGLTAKDDTYVPFIETKKLMESLNGKVRVVEHGGHFLEEDGFTSFTSLMNKIQDYMTR